MFKKKKSVDIPEPPEFLDFPESGEAQEGEEIPEFEEEKHPHERIKKWEEDEDREVRKLPAKMTHEISERAHPQHASIGKSKALFIKVEKFKEIIASIEIISKKVSELEDIAQKIQEIKTKEDSELSDWQEQLNEIKAKLERIEESLESKI